LLLSVTMAFTLGGAVQAVDPGEILISEMNCVACHDAPATLKTRLASRPSPRLDAKNGVRVTPHWMRAFLENPQATQPGTLMPDLLAGLEAPAKAEAAEALTHYLVSLRGDGKERPVGSSLAAINIGKTLYHTVGCVACHAPVEPPPGAAASAEVKEQLAKLEKTAIPLGALEKKYTISALAAFLRDPLKSRPGGRMPSSKLSEGEARAIAAYLLRAQQPSGDAQRLPGLAYDYYEADLPELPAFDRLKPKSSGSTETISTAVAERKNDIALRFHGIIKIARDGEYEFFTKSDDGSRLYIDEQLVVENGGVHPEQERSGKIKLTTGDHAIRVIYFDGGGNVALNVAWEGPGFGKRAIESKVLAHEAQTVRPVGEVEFALDPAKAAKGRELFGTLNCASCHQIDAPGKKAKALAQLNGRQPGGCLSTKAKPGIPKFELTDRQRVVILAQLGNQAGWNEPLTPEQQITRTLTTLNCYACHARERRGGVEGLRREYFANVGEVDLGDEGRIPPTLHGVGAKLRPEWVKTVLVEGGAARPYMATRMPQYGEKNVGHLPGLFAKADERPDALPQPNVFAPGVAGDANKFGRKLIGVGGLTCIACHNLDGNKSLGVPALDLATVGQRLKWDWFRRYLLDPQSLRPGTRMPSFWPGGVATNKELLGGDPEKQIFTIWSYLARKNFTDLPPGLVQGLQELVPDKEPIIYRNFIEGAGPRAIGVGYPEKANLAFDADEQRLALIWQGSFIDAAKHRTGRGQGFQKPLGTSVVAGPPGAPFAVLESENAAWPAESGKAAGWQFLGYQFDQQQRPTFRYSWSGLTVEDSPVAFTQNNDPGIKRTITLRADKASRNLYFRAALADQIVEKDGAFLVAEKATMKFPGVKPFLRVRDGKTELLVPVTFAGQEAKIVQEISW
jgi:cytochrome c2